MIDRALYLPQSWATARVRCQQAAIPDEIGYTPKPAQALAMLERAVAAAVPARWVTADSIYGDHRPLHTWLEAHPLGYVLGISGKEAVELEGLDEAIADYTKAIDLQPDFAQAYLNRGLAHAGQNCPTEAIADYNKAIALQSDYAEAYLNRGATHLAQNRLKEATADFEQAIKFNPNYAKAYNNRGLAYAAQGNPLAARNDFRCYLKLHPRTKDRAQVEQWIAALEVELAKQK